MCPSRSTEWREWLVSMSASGFFFGKDVSLLSSIGIEKEKKKEKEKENENEAGNIRIM